MKGVFIICFSFRTLFLGLEPEGGFGLINPESLWGEHENKLCRIFIIAIPLCAFYRKA